MEKECNFCEIIERKRKAHIVYEDDATIAFLDINPVFKGHVLVIPKKHYPIFDDIPESVLGRLMEVAKKVSIAMEKELKCDGTFIGLNNKVSQSIPHVHLHVIPRKFGENMHGFFAPRIKYESEEEAQQICETIKKGI
ncbi:MAG: HIT domain-containing protein [Candidatus Micrarchaeaceae archaeon]